ncbi:MAG: CHAT domain-containing tetratricopeptide repeat protein [Saprospiraceae bacterium]|nr:CHAT domain-containing tetratricopeptide repeat protein [Saprospiraceae bacterium]
MKAIFYRSHPLPMLFFFLACITSASAQTKRDSASALITQAQHSMDAQQFRQAILQTAGAADLLYAPQDHADSLLLSDAFHHQARAYTAVAELDSAIAAYQQAATLRERTLGAHFETSKTLSNLGDCQCRRRYFEAGLKNLYRSLEIKQQLDPPRLLSVSITQINLSACYREQGNLQQAIELAEKALETQKAVRGADENFPEIGDSYNNLGVMYEESGYYTRSLTYYHTALRIRLAVHGEEATKTADTYNNLATWHIDMGEYARAIPLLEKALGIHYRQPDPNPHAIGTSLINLSSCHSNLGDYHKSLDYSLKALPFFDAGSSAYITVCRNIGADYKNLKWYESAIESYLKTLQFADTSGVDAAWLFNQVAVCYRYQKSFEISLAYHQKAIDLMLRLYPGSHPDLAAFYSDMGVTFSYMGNHDKARRQFESALAICRIFYHEKGENQAIALSELGRIHAMEERFRAADSLFQQAKSVLGYRESFVFDSVTAIPKLIFVLQYQAEAYHHWGGGALLRKSFETWQEAVAAIGYLYQNRLLMRQNLLESGSFAEFLRQNHAACGGAIRVALEMYKISGDRHWLEEAFVLSERAKAFQLRHLAQEADWIQAADLPPALSEDELRLRTQFTALERLRQDLRRSGMADDTPRLLEISGQIFDIKVAYEQVKNQIKATCPACYEQNFGLPIVSAEALQKMQPPNRAILSFFEGDSSTYLFIIGNGSLRYHEYRPPPGDSLPRMMVNWLVQSQHQNLPDDIRVACFEQYVSAAHQIFERYLAPVWAGLPEYLSILPDGSLTAVPFEALLEKMPAQAEITGWQCQKMAFLLSKKVISYAPSATLLAAVLQQTHETPAPRSMLGMAASVSGRRAYRRSGRDELVLDALPNTREEVLMVQNIMGGMVRLDSQATAAEFRQLSDQYRYLHLAVHANADDRVGDDSYLAFFDSLLYVRDIGNLRLRADMVVLSGCKTGGGEHRYGEGTVGMSWAFFRAGAKSLFSTLWDVEDVAMKAFAEPFYTQILAGKPKDQAIKMAKNQLLFSKSFNHPYFWAGIIGSGDMRAIR